jgi:hypothetical protein
MPSPLRHLLCALLLPLCAAQAEPPSTSPPSAPNPPAPAPPSIQKLPDGKIQIGQILINPAIREIRFPAEGNAPDRVLEYAIVTKAGKAYESLLVTETTPTQLNTAFLLLRYQASGELFPIPNKDRDAPLRFPDVPADVKAAARIDIRVEWKDGDQSRSFPINELVQFEPTGKTLSSDPWIYNGSYFNKNHSFMAEAAGDLFSVMKDNNTLANYPGKDGDDEGWIPYPKRAPAPAVKVTVIITPHTPTPSHP